MKSVVWHPLSHQLTRFQSIVNFHNFAIYLRYIGDILKMAFKRKLLRTCLIAIIKKKYFWTWINPLVLLSKHSNFSTEHNFKTLRGMGHKAEPTPLSSFPTVSLRYRCGRSKTPMLQLLCYHLLCFLSVRLRLCMTTHYSHTQTHTHTVIWHTLSCEFCPSKLPGKRRHFCLVLIEIHFLYH